MCPAVLHNPLEEVESGVRILQMGVDLLRDMSLKRYAVQRWLP